MKPTFEIIPHTLKFRFVAGTSRGTLTEHNSYLIRLRFGDRSGIGEVAPLPKLSPDYKGDMVPDIQYFTKQLCQKDLTGLNNLDDITTVLNALGLERFPSIRFGLETALLEAIHGGIKIIFPCDFLKGRAIPINGLVWMGDHAFMQEQIQQKVEQGFRCVKMKVGAIDFDKELDLIEFIRQQYDSQTIELRLDANGAFDKAEVQDALLKLAPFDIHSIEQPIRQGDWNAMHTVCEESPIPVALDEELIGMTNKDQKLQLLEAINPLYIILKPTLLGGFKHCLEWIELAKERNIGWWMTSALESNIGLNAIAQFASHLQVSMPQGLGTGSLYHNNIVSPLVVEGDMLKYDSSTSWEM